MLILSSMLFLTEHIVVGMINVMVVECEFGFRSGGDGGERGTHTGTLVVKVHPRCILPSGIPEIPSPPVQFKSFNCCQTLNGSNAFVQSYTDNRLYALCIL